MNESGIKAAISEAERFIERAREALENSKTDLEQYGGKQIRRASMDLTRALAEMRKP